ncbi:MAG: hypothetical protein QOG86_746 [Thermoleophilaceae bacterium]|nr:hypothetical protein [Thermoleophilaceae bacterium]
MIAVVVPIVLPRGRYTPPMQHGSGDQGENSPPGGPAGAGAAGAS